MPWILDGNNLLAQSREQNLKDPHGRVRLIRELSEFCRQKGRTMTVVFDGDPDPLIPGRDVSLGPLRVIFSGRGREADSVILELLGHLADPAGTTVVTSDRSLSDRARHTRAKTLRSHLFRATLREMAIDAPPSNEDRLTPGEIEEWTRYFSKERRDEKEEALDPGFRRDDER
jgi:predicted RNA-binding protein with PIN domain